LGVKKPALYYFLSDFASSNLTAVGGVFPAREDKSAINSDKCFITPPYWSLA
jgi:hypothetical protein